METKIAIYSDVVCPWCYIGKKRLEDAISIRKKSHPDDKIEIEWRAFQLNPDLAPEGEDRILHMTRKFGSMDRVKMMVQRVADIANSENLPFLLEQEGHQPNTFLLHALIRKAKEYGKDSILSEIFFRKFFAEGKNLSDTNIILESLREAGIQEDDFYSIKENTILLQEVREEEQKGRELGVSGVPFFVFNEKYAVSGAQESNLFLQVFDRLESEIS
ncbi:DsbA family oxidoreductase [Leptospira interrogans]|uniref:Predicted dithiol-disulfide isomerase involved in polyketide biosynthesis n=10 Tax=Leptospira interrogans TaxID=173 RepID=Q8F9M2_LEPIN|nr:DsbA family oxidoreductase [Leptospira interrogans]APH40155.1 Putative polyketide biosynthesis dithiol-disulfide isomerase [Leptospira interrogans serovar Copenhageni/Icterohaemorrhagiae]EMF43513.1 DSBA-like thioredoxin domain protein [Leptospira interrogans serovar Lora str. TE 1992]EMG22712.1 DSBA-like thioredoxin domain protein [Leptospira interrogans serovar Copenhageni str. LT2050]EMN73424.1 DSBA-like thioredoxin domain protein [Leptospira interrogans serovar Bataviae str. UI 08561]EMO